jgi:hypothetical protein
MFERLLTQCKTIETKFPTKNQVSRESQQVSFEGHEDKLSWNLNFLFEYSSIYYKKVDCILMNVNSL